MRRFSIRRTRAVLVKELWQLLRDRVTLQMIVAIPIVQLLLFGFALNTDPKHLPTAVLAQDHSEMARNIVAGLHNTDYFAINHEVTSTKDGESLLRKGEVQFVITIPPDFERKVVRGEHPTLLIQADASDPVATAGALSAANGMIPLLLQRSLHGPLANLRTGEPAFGVALQKMYNPEGFTRYNIVPGLIAIILTMTGVMMTSLSMTRERERGTMENLLAMPVTPMEMMTGKIIPYVLIGLLQSTIIMLVARFLFTVPVVGSLPLFSLALLMFITCNMAIGFTLSAIASNQTQAMQMAIMVTLPSILLSGFLFPFRGMPEWAQLVGNCLPATHFIVISRAIMLKGSNLLEILPHLWPLGVIMVVVMAVAIRRYRTTLD